MSQSVQRHTSTYVTPPKIHPYNKPLNVGKLNDVFSRISTIISNMNWHYRSSEGELVEFNEDETRPLTAAFKQLKDAANELKISSSMLRRLSLPILTAYYHATHEQGLLQFKSQLNALVARKETMDPDDFEVERAILRAKISNYEKNIDAEKYFLEHIKLKLNMAEVRRDSSRVATDNEHEFCMFLVDVYHYSSSSQKST